MNNRPTENRVLLTGASGFLGWNFCRYAPPELDIYAVTHTREENTGRARVMNADLTDRSSLRRIFSLVQPGVVIHAAAASNPNECQSKPESSRRINLDVSLWIADLCAEFKARCIFTSTDLVFDGQSGNYSEDDPVSPISTYGEQKALAEIGMLARCPEMIICRMPLMYGNAGPCSSSFIQPMLRTMQAGGELRLFSDEFRTPLSGRDAVAGILLSIAHIRRGIIHLGGPETISRFNFGCVLKKVFGFDAARLTPCFRSDVPMPAPRPRDVSLDSRRAFLMGFAPGGPAQELAWLRRGGMEAYPARGSGAKNQGS